MPERPTKPRPVREIQAELSTAAVALREASNKLGLMPLMIELERSYPEDMDLERVQDGDVCPPLAWGIHADVGNTKILLEEAIQSLETAARRTEPDMRSDWIHERIKDVNDPAVRALLGFVLHERT